MEQSWDSVCLVTTPVPHATEHRLEIASVVLQDTCVSFNSVSRIVPKGTKPMASLLSRKYLLSVETQPL